MKKQVLVALCATTLGLGACSLQVEDLNNPAQDAFEQTPTPSAIYAASTGLLIGNRAGISAQTGYISQLGILGRESFTLDPADPRYVSEMLKGPLDSGSPAFGGSNWANPYTNIRNTNTLLIALQNVNGMSDTEKEAIQGFAKTIQALDFLIIINTRETAPINVGGGINDPLGPIESREAVFDHIVQLLDEAKEHLKKGGDAFPFPLSNGYVDFDNPKIDMTPANFIRVNRALLARVQVYRNHFSEALTALQESFLDTTKPLTLGVYHSFGTGPGDLTNGLRNNKLYANKAIVTDADRKADGTTIDDRVTRKTKPLDEAVVIFKDEAAGITVTTDLAFALYENQDTPVPVIRNEELILLRAEANIGLGAPANITAAADDINFIRTTSGGLAPRTDLDSTNILDELLKQKRYSLLFEGGHRWIDMRHYNRLDQLVPVLGVDVPEYFPIPKFETDARL